MSRHGRPVLYSAYTVAYLFVVLGPLRLTTFGPLGDLLWWVCAALAVTCELYLVAHLAVDLLGVP